MTDAVISDHIKDLNTEDAGQPLSLSIQNMDARTESTTLNSHLWVPDLVGRISRAVASRLFKRTLKCILFYQILNTKSMGFFSGVKCLPLKAGLYL